MSLATLNPINSCDALIGGKQYMMHFSRFRDRILFFFIAFTVIILAGVFTVVDTTNTTSAKKLVMDTLQVSANSFLTQLSNRSRHLVEATTLLSADFAFKQAYFTADKATILSAMQNHQARISADVMILTDTDVELVASTATFSAEESEKAILEIIALAEESDSGEASMMVLIDGVAYQLAVVPLLAPVQVGWFVVGFRTDGDFLQALKKDSGSEISIIFINDQNNVGLVSTLDSNLQKQLKESMGENTQEDKNIVELNGEKFVSVYSTLQENKPETVLFVLQKSLSVAMKPYERLRQVLMLIAAASVPICLLLGVIISRSVTRPVKLLSNFAESIERGDYTHSVDIKQKDELGYLASTFNGMAKGLEERDNVRDLLGKVVSQEVAEELTKGNITLGGEEKVVTIFFTDIRGFTTLSEELSPVELLSLLNRYLTVVTGEIEAFSGVIDKYIGDAVMALFGAPVNAKDDANNAVKASLAVQVALDKLNREFVEEGLSALKTGVGINSAKVVAGNMGSPNRLNYTVIGDGVNLAARLEMLTKRYGVDIIVSEYTKGNTFGIDYLELDRVRVKGKSEPVTIYTPMACSKDGGLSNDRELNDWIGRYMEMLVSYRNQQWLQAQEKLRSLGRDHYPTLCDMYLERISQLKGEELGDDWDGVYTHTEK